MKIEKTVFNKLAKVTKLQNKQKFSKKKQVKLGLVDEFDYDYDNLNDEVGRLAYSTEEWYDENFDKFIEIRGQLRDVYFNNSEAFIDPADVLADMERLIDIKLKADELGISVEDVYPNWQDHKQLIEDLDYFQERFDKQVDELRNFGL
jgi:ClpP class serine protease